jgi:hypothetical protein
MMKYAGQFIAYALFAAGIGLFSVWPSYHMIDESEALVSVSFSHAAKRLGECRTLTQEELNALPPNMRKPSSCPRGRHPIYLELRSDGEVIFTTTALAAGMWSDGKANIYHRARVSAGRHELFIGMNDSGSASDFDYQETAVLDVGPGQNVVVSFDRMTNTFGFE